MFMGNFYRFVHKVVPNYNSLYYGWLHIKTVTFFIDNLVLKTKRFEKWKDHITLRTGSRVLEVYIDYK